MSLVSSHPHKHSDVCTLVAKDDIDKPVKWTAPLRTEAAMQEVGFASKKLLMMGLWQWRGIHACRASKSLHLPGAHALFVRDQELQ